MNHRTDTDTYDQPIDPVLRSMVNHPAGRRYHGPHPDGRPTPQYRKHGPTPVDCLGPRHAADDPHDGVWSDAGALVLAVLSAFIVLGLGALTLRSVHQLTGWTGVIVTVLVATAGLTTLIQKK